MKILIGPEDLNGSNILAKLPDKEVECGPFVHTYVPKARLDNAMEHLTLAIETLEKIGGAAEWVSQSPGGVCIDAGNGDLARKVVAKIRGKR